MTIIMGIDPGTRFTGVAIVKWDGADVNHVAHGVISIPASLSFAGRLSFLKKELSLWLEKYSPQEVVVEKIFLGKNADSAFKLGHARGVCLAISAEHKAEVHEYAARRVKKVITGTGGASKEQVRLVALQLLGIRSQASLDASDALALTLCHAQCREVKIRIE